MNRKSAEIVNVASVPQRSPFRYPGGKTWLIPQLRKWLKSLSPKPKVLVEPFTGGGIVGLTTAFERLAEHVVMVELDQDVASVWETILGPENSWLTEQISEFEMNLENARNIVQKKCKSVKCRAFQTIVKNRTFHGGILASGATFVRSGENGRGVSSRWYAETLCRRIQDIGVISDRITFVNGDGLSVMKQRTKDPATVFFIDPPYTAGTGKRAGRRLYNCADLDHDMLFELAAEAEGDFLMTYDNDPDVISLANRHNFDTELVAMKNTHHAKMTELLIGKDLGWARATKDESQGLLFDLG